MGGAALWALALAPAAFQDCAAQDVTNVTIHVASGTHAFRTVTDGAPRAGETVLLGFYSTGGPPADSSRYENYDPTLDEEFEVVTSDSTDSGGKVNFTFDGEIEVPAGQSAAQLALFFLSDRGTELYTGLTSSSWLAGGGEVSISLDEWETCLRATNLNRCLPASLYDGAGNAGFPFADAESGGTVAVLKVALTPSNGSKWRFRMNGIQDPKPRWVASEEEVPVLYGPWVIEFMPVVGRQRPFPLSLEVAPGTTLLNIAAIYRTLPVPEIEIQQVGPDALRVGFADRPQSDAYEIAWRGGAAPGVGDRTFAKGQGEVEALADGGARFWFEVPSGSLADGAQCFWIELVERR